VFARADDGRPAGARDGSGSVIAGTGGVAERLVREWDAAHPREPESLTLNPLLASGRIGVYTRVVVVV